MEMNRNFWEDNRPNANTDQVKYESANSSDEPALNKYRLSFEGTPLNFSTGDDECLDCPTYQRTATARLSRQDPMSHRIIEKRRRDRMNNCLADLSRLIPVEYMKKGRGRVEKTEIIEMAIKHMKHLQYLNHYRLGYQECMSETMRFMVEVEGHFPRDSFSIKLLNHLQQHCDHVCKSTSDTTTQHVPMNTNDNVVESNNNVYEDNQQEVNNEKYAYKYKNDIKLRFNQDPDFNTTKMNKDYTRRNSCTSNENQSSSISSPTQSEVCARMSSSECENIVSQTIQRTPVIMKPNNNNIDVKTNNFGVPAFILHAKGSYYIPITLDYQVLLPHLGAYDLLNISNDVSLHPVAINVNFQPPKPQNKEFPLG